MGNGGTHLTGDSRRAVAVIASVGLAAGAITLGLSWWRPESSGMLADAAAPPRVTQQPVGTGGNPTTRVARGAPAARATSGSVSDTDRGVSKNSQRSTALARAASPEAAVEVTDPLAPPPTVIKAPKGTAGPARNAVPKHGAAAGSEAMPSAQAQPRPRPKSSQPLLKTAPKSARARGRLVAEFPSKVMAPSGGSTLTTSATTTQGKRTQVTLTAHTAASAASVRSHYEKLWASLGLTPRETSDGTLSFSGAHESVTLSFPASATDTRYALFGTFRTP